MVSPIFKILFPSGLTSKNSLKYVVRSFKDILLKKFWHIHIKILRASTWSSQFLGKVGLSITMETSIKISKDSPIFTYKHAHTVDCTSRKHYNFCLLFSKIKTWQNWKQKHEWLYLAFTSPLHYDFLNWKVLAFLKKKT